MKSRETFRISEANLQQKRIPLVRRYSTYLFSIVFSLLQFFNNILSRKHANIFRLVKIQTCRVEIVIKNFSAYLCITIFLLTCSTYYFLVFLFICLTFFVNIHLRRCVSRSNGSRTMRYPAAHKENVYSLYEDLLLITFLC